MCFPHICIDWLFCNFAFFLCQSIKSLVFFLFFWHLIFQYWQKNLVLLKQIPIWWRWYYWGSPIAWTIYGLVTSQFGDLSSETDVPGVGLMIVKDYLKRNMGYDHDFLPVVAVMHLVFVLLFALIFGFGIKCLNFQKRWRDAAISGVQIHLQVLYVSCILLELNAHMKKWYHSSGHGLELLFGRKKNARHLIDWLCQIQMKLHVPVRRSLQMGCVKSRSPYVH